MSCSLSLSDAGGFLLHFSVAFCMWHMLDLPLWNIVLTGDNEWELHFLSYVISATSSWALNVCLWSYILGSYNFLLLPTLAVMRDNGFLQVLTAFLHRMVIFFFFFSGDVSRTVCLSLLCFCLPVWCCWILSKLAEGMVLSLFQFLGNAF